MKWSHLKDYIGKMMIADFHDCNADCPPDCKYKDTTSAHSRFKIYHFDNYYFKQFISQKLYSKIQCFINHAYHFKFQIILCKLFFWSNSNLIDFWVQFHSWCRVIMSRDKRNFPPLSLSYPSPWKSLNINNGTQLKTLVV